MSKDWRRIPTTWDGCLFCDLLHMHVCGGNLRICMAPTNGVIGWLYNLACKSVRKWVPSVCAALVLRKLGIGDERYMHARRSRRTLRGMYVHEVMLTCACYGYVQHISHTT